MEIIIQQLLDNYYGASMLNYLTIFKPQLAVTS